MVTLRLPRHTLCSATRALLVVVLAAATLRASEDTPVPSVADGVYGAYHANLTFDVYDPISPTTGPHPLVIYMHGGQGATGDKSDVITAKGNQTKLLLANGFKVAAINFRPYPEFIYPAQRDDAGVAMQFFRFNAATYDIDPDRIVIWGDSGGSLIGGWLTYGDDLANPLGTPQEQLSSRPQGWLNFSGLSNFTLMTSLFPAHFFNEDTLGDVDPLVLIDTSVSLQVANVTRSFTPPVASFYEGTATLPPLTDPHDPTLMDDLHANLLASFPSVAADSITELFQVGVPQPHSENLTKWCMGLAGLDHQYSLGRPLAGTGGACPQLWLTGDFSPGGNYNVFAKGSLAQPLTLFLVVGFAQIKAPFKGGTLWPSPDAILEIPTFPNGEVNIPGTLDPGVIPGFSFWLQFWHNDPAAPVNFAGSNGVKLTISS